MHILYIHQHFATPAGTTGTRSYEFARRWVKAGHKVTLIAGHHDIGGLKLTKKLIQKQSIEGINVVVVGTTYSNKQSYLRRIISFLCFMFLSIYAGLRTKAVDVTYATSTPLTVGIPAMVLKWLKRVPFIFEVRDQWPEVPIGLGVIKNKIVIKLLLILEKSIYKSAASIVALSPGMAEGIRKIIGEQKPIVLVPNSCDTELFHPDINDSRVRREKGWGNKLVLLYFGVLSKANGLGFIVDAAERLKTNPDIHFVLVGDGSEKTVIVKRVEHLGLDNIEILDSIPKGRLPEFVAACDIAMVIFANYPILEYNSANKFFDSLSAGKPVLLNYSGWQRNTLEENNAGFGCKQYDVDEFVEKVLYLNSHKKELLEMGQNARRIAEEKFDRDKLAQEILEVIIAAKKQI
jgi:glycosyltransferase involved in cell wall biosynthesis